MAEIIISEKQLEKIQELVSQQKKLELAKENWNKFSEEEKEFVIHISESLYPKDAKLLKEAWYNTVMDILGIIDPTPIVDIINSTSYFIQGDTLFGILTLVGAIPYAGDIVAKPVLGALKIGSKSTKALESALKVMKTAQVGSKEYKAAANTIEMLAKEPGIVGSFLQKMGGGLGNKIIKTIDEIPAGPFKGMKNTIKNYFELLSNAGKKSAMFQKRAGVLAKNFQKGTTTVKDVELLKNYLKTQKVFNPATLSKPGFFTNVFFGGIPRLFRSPSGRRMRVMMQSTKWWLGFLDYIGMGNFVGAEELAKKMGDENMIKKIEEYQKTPNSEKYFREQFGDESGMSQTQDSYNTQTQTPKQESDPLSNFLRNLFVGQANPLPGI
jgi:hypothetical protein